MGEASAETKRKIIESARQEFLDKGFTGASLRIIAARAGVTTGALYRHFADKDALFCALVDGAIEATTNAIMTADVLTHQSATDVLGAEHAEDEKQTLARMLDYIYEDFDAFTLLLTKAAGSTHEHFVEEMCDLYTKNCLETFTWMYEQQYAAHQVDEMTVHVIATSIINAFAEIIQHRIPKEKAIAFITDIREFFHFGTMHMMGIPCGAAASSPGMAEN